MVCPLGRLMEQDPKVSCPYIMYTYPNLLTSFAPLFFPLLSFRAKHFVQHGPSLSPGFQELLGLLSIAVEQIPSKPGSLKQHTLFHRSDIPSRLPYST